MTCRVEPEVGDVRMETCPRNRPWQRLAQGGVKGGGMWVPWGLGAEQSTPQTGPLRQARGG